MERATPISKIFCIGYPRTGTTSMCAALNELGFRAWHYSGLEYYRQTLDILKTKNIDYPFFEKFDAFADVPIFYVYKELDQKYPGSKFVLTTRNRYNWFESMKWMLRCAGKDYIEANEGNRLLWKDLYADKLVEHAAEVKNYFSDRLHDLFIREIGKMNYRELAGFLGVKSKNAPFPHLNRRLP